MSQRLEFIAEARLKEVPLSALCQQCGISRKTGYKWPKREESEEGLADRRRRPRASPHQTSLEVEALVCELRRKEPVWGGRKIRDRLCLDGVQDLPAPSTITDIRRRHALLSPPIRPQRDLVRFKAEQPSDLLCRVTKDRRFDFRGHTYRPRRPDHRSTGQHARRKGRVLLLAVTGASGSQ